jgi:hypothetical protein
MPGSSAELRLPACEAQYSPPMHQGPQSRAGVGSLFVDATHIHTLIVYSIPSKVPELQNSSGHGCSGVKGTELQHWQEAPWRVSTLQSNQAEATESVLGRSKT